MNQPEDILAQLLAEAMDNPMSPAGASENGAKEEVDPDRMPWPAEFFEPGDGRHFRACRSMYAEVLLRAIKDADREFEQETKRREQGHPPARMVDVAYVTTPSEDLRVVCDAAGIEMEAFTMHNRKRVEDGQNDNG
jgi:hypothetical protein